jgi:hypothetical protein
MFTESLLAAMLTFTPWYGDVESSQDRAARLHTIAQAINHASLAAVCSPDAPPLPPLVVPANANNADDNQEPEEPPAEPACTRLWRGEAKELAFLLLTQARYETHLALHVHQGKCRVHLGECDGGKAASLWQLQWGPHLPKDEWSQLSGTDLFATTHAAFEAARILSRARNYCGTTTGAIALFGTGRTCEHEPAKKRAAFMKRLLAKY